MSDRLIELRRALRRIQNPRLPNPDRRNQESHRRILDATVDLVLVGGWSGLTMEAIARRARVSKQTIYRWWSSKADVLFEAVLGDGYSWPAFPDTGEFEADLVSGIRNLVAEFSEPSFDRLMRALFVGAQEDKELARKLDRSLSETALSGVIRQLEAARDRGQVGCSLAPEVMAELIYGAVFRRWFLDTGELGDDCIEMLAAAALQLTSFPTEVRATR